MNVPATKEQTPEEQRLAVEEQTANQAEADIKARQELQDNTEDRLTAVFDGTYDELADEENDDEAEETEDKDGTPSEDTEDKESEEGAEDDDEDTEVDKAGEAAEDDESAPTLPEAYRRSLHAYGWQDEEINQNLKNLGDSFVKTAERLHGNRNAELQEWAQAGRNARQKQSEGQATGQPSQEQPSQQLPQKLAPVDVAKLKKDYGEDELIDAIVGPVNAVIESVNAVLPQIQKGQETVNQAEIQQVQREVDKFFGAESLSPYDELYGADSKGLSESQIGHRNKVLDAAYDLMVGAQTLRNQALPLADALEHAHAIVSKDFKAAETRSAVKKEAKKRNHALSQKPSRRGGKEQPSGEPTQDELVNRTANRLHEVFG